MNNIAYICDRRACIDCNNDDCMHTTNIDHAKNFIKCKDGKYIEVVNTGERPSGKWIEEIGDCEGKTVRYICSNCGDDDGWINYNFCPICGAKMKGAVNETE